MNFVHYIVCPACSRQIRLDVFDRMPIYCCEVFYWADGNVVSKIKVVYVDENGGAK